MNTTDQGENSDPDRTPGDGAPDAPGAGRPRAARAPRGRVIARFERAAAGYDAHAVVPGVIAERLLEHLDPIRLTVHSALDLGCGTGVLLPGLAQRFSGARLVAVDLSAGMLARARGRRLGILRRALPLLGDAHALPLGDGCVDLVASSTLLPWCDAGVVLAECARVLRPGGLLLVATAGPDTLTELRESFAAIDGHRHVHDFADVHDVADEMIAAGFEGVVGEAERLAIDYPDVDALVAELRALGLAYCGRDAAPGLGGRARLERLRAEYPRRAGRCPATCEVLYLHGWRAAPRAAGPVEVAPPPRRG